MESLTRDEIETVRIHIGEAKERLMNQRRYNEAKEYEVIENKLLAMLETELSAEPSYEAVMRYCEKRNLALIDCGELHDLEYEAWTQKPKRQKGLWVVETEADIKSGTNAISGYKCNICGYYVPWDFTHKSPFFIEEYNFCPHCGADMRREQK